MNTGRPELRLLLDRSETTVPLAVYMDRDSVTEAVADYREGSGLPRPYRRRCARRNAGCQRRPPRREHQRVPGHPGLPSTPEADIVQAARRAIRPVKPVSRSATKTVTGLGQADPAASAVHAQVLADQPAHRRQAGLNALEVLEGLLGSFGFASQGRGPDDHVDAGQGWSQDVDADGRTATVHGPWPALTVTAVQDRRVRLESVTCPARAAD